LKLKLKPNKPVAFIAAVALAAAVSIFAWWVLAPAPVTAPPADAPANGETVQAAKTVQAKKSENYTIQYCSGVYPLIVEIQHLGGEAESFVMSEEGETRTFAARTGDTLRLRLDTERNLFPGSRAGLVGVGGVQFRVCRAGEKFSESAYSLLSENELIATWTIGTSEFESLMTRGWRGGRR